MNDICNLTIISTLAELSFAKKYSKTLKIEIEKLKSKVYNLYLYSPDSRCITVFEIFCNENASYSESEDFQLSSLKTFCLPCNVSELLSTKEKIWALTDEVINIKPHFECAVKEGLRIKNAVSEDFMDVDFDHKTFQMMQELNVRLPKSQNSKLQNGKFFVRSFLSKHNVVLCYENIPTMSWNLQLVVAEENSKGFSSKFVSLLNISLSSIKSDCLFLTDQGSTDRYSKPVVIIIQPESISCSKLCCSRNNIFEKYFETSLSSNNCVCLVGFSDGKVMWASFSLFKTAGEKNTELQFLYDLNQPVANIHFLEKIENVEGHGFLIIIGVFGKVALLAAEKLFSNATEIESTKSLYVVSSYLQVSVKESMLLGDNILHVCGAGNLYASKYTIDSSVKNELKVVSKKFDFCGIISMILVDKEIGLILFRTSIGSLYLAKYKAVETQNDSVLSLPSIMAQCLHQSSVMRELISIQSLQRRFFAALTVFASLKHKGIRFEDKFHCSASEIASSKKILLDINLQNLKQLNLDPDLWKVTASINSCFSENYKGVSKTIPYSSDQPSLFIELNESEFQASSASVLPLLIEIGLILSITHEMKSLDCFKLVEKLLPMYIRIQTLVIHEFYFLAKSTNVPTSHNRNSSRSIFQTMNEIAKRKPISNLLKLNIDILSDLPNKFQFCFPISSIQEILDKNKETDPCHFVSKLLLRKSISHAPQGNESLSCRNKPVTISVEKIDSTIHIMLASKDIGLLLGMRMAALELLLSHQLSCEINPQTYVSIPGSISRICEDVSERISNCKKDISSDKGCEITVIMLYKELRQEISEKLPVL